jgi:AraC-like DNA-binding protein
VTFPLHRRKFDGNVITVTPITETLSTMTVTTALHTDHARTFDDWRRLVSTSFVPLEASPVRPGSFAGTLAGRRLNELALVRVDAAAHHIERTDRLVAAGGPGYYKLSLQLTGTGLLIQDGREAVLSPGDVAIYDTQRPYTLSLEEDFSSLVMMFPKQMLGLAPEDMAELTAVRMGTEQRAGRAVVPFLNGIAAMLPELDGPIGHRLAMNAIDALSTLLADEAYSRPDAAAHGHERMLRRIQHFIEGQLASPALTPASIARTHFMSTRSLHKLFEDTGTTVAAWIRGRRLEAARRDLADPLQADVPVGAIGARWGLPDPAHFSRVFRAAHGCSPSAYRHTALAAAQLA